MEKSQNSDVSVAEPVVPHANRDRTSQSYRPSTAVEPVQLPYRASGGAQPDGKARIGGLDRLPSAGWLGVDLYLWVASAFSFSAGLGW